MLTGDVFNHDTWRMAHKDGEKMIIIGRHINGITLNPGGGNA